MLDEERLRVPSIHAFAPVPARVFVEHHVTRDMDALADGIIQTVRLGPWFVAEQNHCRGAAVKLLEVRPGVLHVPYASECAQEVNGWAFAVPCFVRRQGTGSGERPRW